MGDNEEVVNYARAYDGTIILLFEMGVTHDWTAFQSPYNGVVSPLNLHKRSALTSACSFYCRGKETD